MTSPKIRLLGWASLPVLFLGAIALGGDRVPRDAKPLADFVAAAEKQGYTVVEAEWDDGRCEIEGYKGDEGYELHVNPMTGDTLSEHREAVSPKPPQSALPLSKVLAAVSNAGYTSILSAEFKSKRGSWEIEVDKDGQKRELQVEAASGKVVSDRVDD